MYLGSEMMVRSPKSAKHAWPPLLIRILAYYDQNLLGDRMAILVFKYKYILPSDPHESFPDCAYISTP